jgi:hypothetical protein
LHFKEKGEAYEKVLIAIIFSIILFGAGFFTGMNAGIQGTLPLH